MAGILLNEVNYGGGYDFLSTAGFTPVGTVISVMGKTAPQNYLSCDGTAYNILDYPELAAYFKEQFGSYNYFGGDGTTTFAVPDLRGEFLRGTGTNSHNYQYQQGSGAAVGQHQDATRMPSIWEGSSGEGFFTTNSATSGYETKIEDHKLRIVNPDSRPYSSATIYFGPSSTDRGAWTAGASYSTYTSRPTNTSILFCIAYKNIFIDQKKVIDLTGRERIVGQVIEADGTEKVLYEKSLSISTSNDGLAKVADLSNISLDKIYSITGNISLNSEGINYTLELSYTQANGIGAVIIYNSSEKSIYVQQTGWGEPTTGVVTIRYTKTTG